MLNTKNLISEHDTLPPCSALHQNFSKTEGSKLIYANKMYMIEYVEALWSLVVS